MLAQHAILSTRRRRVQRACLPRQLPQRSAGQLDSDCQSPWQQVLPGPPQVRQPVRVELIQRAPNPGQPAGHWPSHLGILCHLGVLLPTSQDRQLAHRRPAAPPRPTCVRQPPGRRALVAGRHPAASDWTWRWIACLAGRLRRRRSSPLGETGHSGRFFGDRASPGIGGRGDRRIGLPSQLQHALRKTIVQPIGGEHLHPATQRLDLLERLSMHVAGG